LLEARDIHKTYYQGEKAIPVLKGLNLKLERDRFIAVVGPSGAGKSTLLHILGGLDEPSRGRVILEGQDIYGLNDTALSGIRNRSMGFVFQFYHLLSEFTVLENVLMPVWVRLGSRVRQEGIRDNALGLLGRLGLSQRVDHYPDQLSGGEQQRVAIARGLINKPEFLFCDEPTGNLDLETGSEIIGLLREINLENGMSVILVTHNMELAALADIVYQLKDGIFIN